MRKNSQNHQRKYSNKIKNYDCLKENLNNTHSDYSKNNTSINSHTNKINNTSIDNESNLINPSNNLNKQVSINRKQKREHLNESQD